MNFYSLDSLPGRTATVDGKEYLFFSGYSYLGVQHVAAFQQLITAGAKKYGWLFPSSRISNTRLGIFEEAEALLASVTGMEDAVIVSSGFVAGRLATALFAENIINVPPYHPAIKRSNTHPLFSKEYSTDSVDILHAEINSFQFIENDDADIALVADDSHGIGVIGNNGAGISTHLHTYKNISKVICFSLSKALGIQGGAVCCNKEAGSALRAMPEYTASSAPSPALLHAFIHAQHIYVQQRTTLKNNIAYLRSLLSGMPGVISHAELPVFILPETIETMAFEEKGVIISSFSYPDPAGKKYNRIVLNALHTKDDMDYLFACICDVCGE